MLGRRSRSRATRAVSGQRAARRGQGAGVLDVQADGVDTYLGPEMKSTGEVMGIDRTSRARWRRRCSPPDMALKPNARHPPQPRRPDKAEALPLIPQLAPCGYRLYATEGTATHDRRPRPARDHGDEGAQRGHPNVVDVINDGTVQCVINTPEGRITGTLRDGFHIRRAAAEKRIPCFTSIDTARAAVEALATAASYSVARSPSTSA